MIEDYKIFDYLFIKDPDKVINEVKYILSLISSDLEADRVEKAFNDIKNIYNGDYKGYRKCNTKYHDLDHSLAVFLATARLTHSLILSGKQFDDRIIILGLISALFHDIGYIQRDDDTEGTGAKYTIGHEERSVDILEDYLMENGFEIYDVVICTRFILTTCIRMPFSELPFETEEIELMAKVVGSSDIISQISDRIYLEKLLFLYKEFREGGIQYYKSEVEILKTCEDFYKGHLKKRLDEDYNGIVYEMKRHFIERWSIGKDLYQEYVKKNINYLRNIIEKDINNYKNLLRRTNIVSQTEEK